MSAFKSSIFPESKGPGSQQKNKRNFLKENVKNLKSLAKKIEEPTVTKLNSVDPKMKKCNSVQLKRVSGLLKVNTLLASSNSVSSITPSKANLTSTAPTAIDMIVGCGRKKKISKSLSKLYDKSTIKECKDQSIQTVDTQLKIDIDGVVRYPTNNDHRNTGEESCIEVVSGKEPSLCPSERGTRQNISQLGGQESSPRPNNDSQQKGIECEITNSTPQYKEKKPAKEKNEPSKPLPNYQKGVFPKYVQEIKKSSFNKSDDIVISAGGARDALPTGYILMLDSDRMTYLQLFRQSYSELVAQLNSLPVRSDTLRAKTKKTGIEKELDRLERGIKLFSRERLYIRVEP